MGFYDDMADVASDVLTEFQQDDDGTATIHLVRLDTVTQGAETYDRPSRGAPIRFELAATAVVISNLLAKGSAGFTDGKTIIGSDLMVTSAVFESTPLLTDMIEMGGTLHKIKKISQIPAAGTPVVWKFVVEG